MPRVSTKENKNIYFRKREELNLTREEASLLLETMAPERIEKIENERTIPHPDEVLLMAEKYKSPQLCNYYCANECPIGKHYVPEIKIKDLSAITMEMLAVRMTLPDISCIAAPTSIITMMKTSGMRFLRSKDLLKTTTQQMT